MEKRKPTHDLAAIKSAFRQPESLEATRTAIRDAAFLGFDRQGMVDVIRSIERVHFVKSMTSHQDHRIWQAVYHAPSSAGVLYVKFTAGIVTEFLLPSFKERSDGR